MREDGGSLIRRGNGDDRDREAARLGGRCDQIAVAHGKERRKRLGIAERPSGSDEFRAYAGWIAKADRERRGIHLAVLAE
ncbi:hypothetical protein NSE01_10530 [Novosphingobium sediminis]|uniref:Uncharacterized protein n=1 Tax=Novosphingobium sediminis TaxID=707214 RepID=A0A512AHM6_9SPHN|nr:hypothetical protein NSE01_10530 [Novosphingobium sediminis]